MLNASKAKGISGDGDRLAFRLRAGRVVGFEREGGRVAGGVLAVSPPVGVARLRVFNIEKKPFTDLPKWDEFERYWSF